MAKKSSGKEVVITAQQAKDYKRMDLAAEKFGISVPYIKKLFNEGKIHRYKLGAATMVDCAEIEALIRMDEGNHGPAAAPGQAQR